MEEIKILNGREYKIVVTENEIMAREIIRQNFGSFRIGYCTDGYTTKFYKIFGNEKKEIGKLIYDPEKAKFSLWKFINPKVHIMKKTGEVAVNGAIYAKLRVGDYIYFQISKKTYKIRVEKAARVGNYKNFETTAYNSELQFFIPVAELTEIESKKRNNSRKGKKLA